MSELIEPQPMPAQAYVYDALVTRAVDGDTVEVVIDVGFNLTTTHRLRLVDVNTPEDNAGKPAAAFTRDQLVGKPVRIRTTKADSFGRFLARIWLPDGSDYNARLVASGFAVPFRVGTGGA